MLRVPKPRAQECRGTAGVAVPVPCRAAPSLCPASLRRGKSLPWHRRHTAMPAGLARAACTHQSRRRAVEGAAELFPDGGKRFPAAGGNIWIQLLLHVQPARPDLLLHGLRGVALPRRGSPCPRPMAGSSLPCPQPTGSLTVSPSHLEPRHPALGIPSARWHHSGLPVPIPSVLLPIPGHGGGSRCPPAPFVSLRKIDLEARWKSPAANRVRRCLTAAPRGST